MKKITDEMIMDFADGVLSESDSRLVIKHIKKDKRSMEKFLKFQKTSMLFGSKNEKFYDNQPIPKSTLELITSEENRNKKSEIFLDSIKNYISDFNLKQNFAVAVCALFIGFLVTILLNKIILTILFSDQLTLKKLMKLNL